MLNVKTYYFCNKYDTFFFFKIGLKAMLTFFKLSSPTGVIGKFPHQVSKKWHRNKSLESWESFVYVLRQGIWLIFRETCVFKVTSIRKRKGGRSLKVICFKKLCQKMPVDSNLEWP